MDINTRIIKLNLMYDALYEQEMLMERRMLTMDDIKRDKVRIDLEEIKADMKKIQDKMNFIIKFREK